MRGALEGIRVLELGSMLAGPFCARLLGDYGADVVKVEDPTNGDLGRKWGRNKLDGRSLWWPSMARNKRCLTVDLRQPEGQELVRGLCARTDIVVENFRPGTLERWGIGPDELLEINPRLIVVRVSGFGQTGPARERAGFGVVGEAMGGIRYTTGHPEEAPPRVGISLGDELASVFGVIGALLALRAREVTGRGQVVDVAIYEAVYAMMESVVTEYASLGVLPERTGSRLAGVAPSNIYRTVDDDWVIIAGNAENVYRRLMAAIGRPELGEDERFADHLARARNYEELDHIIESWTRVRPASEILATLETAGVPACKIYSPADIMGDPHYRARDMLLRMTDGDMGELVVPGVVPKLSETPGGVRWLGPPLGAHTAEILIGELGLTEAALADYRSRGIV